jgi:hypothetical protein
MGWRVAGLYPHRRGVDPSPSAARPAQGLDSLSSSVRYPIMSTCRCPARRRPCPSPIYNAVSHISPIHGRGDSIRVRQCRVLAANPLNSHGLWWLDISFDTDSGQGYGSSWVGNRKHRNQLPSGLLGNLSSSYRLEWQVPIRRAVLLRVGMIRVSRHTA